MFSAKRKWAIIDPVSPALSLIEQSAQIHPAQKKWYRSLSQRAAVCILIEDRPDIGTAMLMIQRAEHAGDTWSGQMAFPGGKQDITDANITCTALRECEEELGIESAYLQRFGRLSDILARPYRLQQKPMVVSPLLFKSSQELILQPNQEVADALWIPLDLFLNPANRQNMTWTRAGVTMHLPCYFYQDKRIWGLSLLMIDELVQKIVSR